MFVQSCEGVTLETCTSRLEQQTDFLPVCVVQGIQRRITVTIAHEAGNDFEWKEVKELVIGE